MNLDLIGQHPNVLLRNESEQQFFLPSVGWSKAAFVVFWEAQSQASSLAYIGLLAFFNIWIALGAMLAWSLLATVFFFSARERGYPNLLTCQKMPKERRGLAMVSYAFTSVCRAWLAGINAFVYTRCSSCLVKSREKASLSRRVLRFAALGVGMTMFGVSTVEHMLRSAGYSGARLARLGLIGPFLNVPYRVLISAAVLAVLQDSVQII